MSPAEGCGQPWPRLRLGGGVLTRKNRGSGHWGSREERKGGLRAGGLLEAFLISQEDCLFPGTAQSAYVTRTCGSHV